MYGKKALFAGTSEGNQLGKIFEWVNFIISSSFSFHFIYFFATQLYKKIIIIHCVYSFYRLTGKPSRDDFPESSVDFDTFLMTIPCEPRQLVPRLCDFANDLLKVAKLIECLTFLMFL